MTAGAHALRGGRRNTGHPTSLVRDSSTATTVLVPSRAIPLTVSIPPAASGATGRPTLRLAPLAAG
jgi:hypothetical protein